MYLQHLRGQIVKHKTLISAAIFSILSLSSPLSAEFESPEIFVLGDSQFLFGSGPAFHDFFLNINEHCSTNFNFRQNVKTLKNVSTGVLGVRSTSLNSWVGRDDESKTRICSVDPNWHINASMFGSIKYSDERFLQIGREEPFKFCKQNRSAFEVMFEKQYFNPKLFVMFFLGNSANRWAESEADAKADALATLQQIPADMPCIFMTTAPPHKQNMIDTRLKGQENLRKAFKEVDNHCTFIDGLTPETIKANLGNDHHFKFNVKAGKVKDVFHPNEKGAKRFLALKKTDICQAVSEQFSSKAIQ